MVHIFLSLRFLFQFYFYTYFLYFSIEKLFKALAQETNVGIKYEYLLPITSNESDENSQEIMSNETEQTHHTTIPDSPVIRHTLKSGVIALSTNDENGKLVDKRKRRFFWKIVGFTQCSKLCGGGTQSPVIRCVRENPMRYFKPKRCSHLSKPLTNENLLRCNTQPCPAYWKTSDWGLCQCKSNEKREENYKKREVKCVQELGTGMVIQVPAVACSDEKPKSIEICDCPKITDNNYQLYHEKENQNIAINSIKNRPYANSKRISTIYGNNTISKRAHSDNKNNGAWLTSNWSEKVFSFFFSFQLQKGFQCQLAKSEEKQKFFETKSEYWFSGTRRSRKIAKNRVKS